LEPALAAGNEIMRRYRLVAQIGAGGMSTVWRARDARRGVDVALKMYGGLTVDLAALEAFALEAELAARMLSRNVARALDRGVDARGAPFIVYELLDGEDLGARLSREERLSLALFGDVVVQTCCALERAHGIGVVHRDIKPENVFLCDDGVIKLVDFGIARRLGRQSGVRVRPEVSGTFPYMSPEVLLHGRPADARSDLYALGVVAYECFTGRLPYQGEALGLVLLEHARGTCALPSELRYVKDFAGALDAWFERALDRDPDARFQSAPEMAAALVERLRPPCA
jgi:serine/threonine-protein kinase